MIPGKGDANQGATTPAEILPCAVRLIAGQEEDRVTRPEK